MYLNKKNFVEKLNKNYSFEKNPLVAIGVSGGPDSMALLFLLKEWSKSVNGKIVVLIVDHNLRLNSSKEAKLVQKFILEKKIKTTILTVRRTEVRKKNMQEARINRYKLLTNYCKKNNILHLFVGHHYDDNIETFIYRRISGSDFNGLESIKLNSINNKTNIIRPLISFTKKEIIKYNIKNNIPYIEDPSNINLDYTRPSIRKFLNETTTKNLNQIKYEFSTIKSYSKLYKTMISELLIMNIISINKNNVVFDISKFLNLDNLILERLIKIIYKFFNHQNFFLRSNKIQNFINVLKTSEFKTYNIRGMIIKKTNNSLIFSKKLTN